MKDISFKCFQDQNPFVISNIQDGFDQFPYIILKANAQQYLLLFQQLIRLNGESHCFADCYFGKLSPARQQGLVSLLPSTYRKLLLQYQFTEHNLYFSFNDPEDPMLEVLAYLSAKEYLFSTFYFTKYRCTVWTNYNLTYPIFFPDKEGRLFYAAMLTDYQ